MKITFDERPGLIEAVVTQPIVLALIGFPRVRRFYAAPFTNAWYEVLGADTRSASDTWRLRLAGAYGEYQMRKRIESAGRSVA